MWLKAKNVPAQKNSWPSTIWATLNSWLYQSPPIRPSDNRYSTKKKTTNDRVMLMLWERFFTFGFFSKILRITWSNFDEAIVLYKNRITGEIAVDDGRWTGMQIAGKKIKETAFRKNRRQCCQMEIRKSNIGQLFYRTLDRGSVW